MVLSKEAETFCCNTSRFLKLTFLNSKAHISSNVTAMASVIVGLVWMETNATTAHQTTGTSETEDAPLAGAFLKEASTTLQGKWAKGGTGSS